MLFAHTRIPMLTAESEIEDCWRLVCISEDYLEMASYQLSTMNMTLQSLKNDTCGVRTHTLSEWRLEPPP